MLNAIDRPPRHRGATWSPGLVMLRLVEAFEVEAKLPEVRGPRWQCRLGLAGDGTRIRGYRRLVGRAPAGCLARLGARESAYPQEVTRMEEAMLWLEILEDQPGEQRCLVAWAKIKAKPRRASLRKLTRRTGWSHRHSIAGAIRARNGSPTISTAAA